MTRQPAPVAARLGMSKDPEIRSYALRLSVIFGDPSAKTELRKLLADTRADIEARKLALLTLVTVRDSDAYPLVVSLLQETALASPAARSVVTKDDKEINFRTANERLVIASKDIEELAVSDRSIMPEGLLKGLTAEEVQDLIAYLRHSKQVPLPK